MKKVLASLAASVILLACGNNSNNKEQKKEETNTITTTTDLSQNPDYQKGLELASKSDCFTCHEIDAKKTGPAYREVANKYASYPDTIVSHLANKIIEGGTGVWGNVPMIPHPNLSKEDAEAMVKYVLLLKK